MNFELQDIIEKVGGKINETICEDPKVYGFKWQSINWWIGVSDRDKDELAIQTEDNGLSGEPTDFIKANTEDLKRYLEENIKKIEL